VDILGASVSLLRVKQIQLANTHTVALVDDCDYERVSAFSWCIQKSRYTLYARRSGKRKPGSRSPSVVLMHRLIMDAPKGLQVDHINHNGLDNRRSNLRLCTQSQNLGNTRVKSGKAFKGVHLDQRGRFRASIGINGRTVSLGNFQSAQHAAAIYNFHARKKFGKFASVNVLDDESRLIDEALSIVSNSKKRSGNSMFRGVCWSKQRRKWRATRGGRHIGYFQTEEEARDAYLAAT